MWLIPPQRHSEVPLISKTRRILLNSSAGAFRYRYCAATLPVKCLLVSFQAFASLFRDTLLSTTFLKKTSRLGDFKPGRFIAMPYQVYAQTSTTVETTSVASSVDSPFVDSKLCLLVWQKPYVFAEGRLWMSYAGRPV